MTSSRRHGAKPRERHCRLAMAGALALAACAPDPLAELLLAPSRGGAGTYTGLSLQIFVPRCASASCHGGSPPPAFPQLDTDAGWAAMVNVQSQQAVMDMVEPGVPGESWLMIRLLGEGGRPYMPIGDAQLTAAELAAVEGWIARGAPND